MKPIRRSYLVSFPRSGHHWLVRMLQRYYGERLRYCESYTDPEHRMDACPETNLEKSHDFSLDLDPQGKPVVVLCRRQIIDAFSSWREQESPAVALNDFIKQREWYWLAFLGKWTEPAPNRLVVWHQELKSNPVVEVGRVIRFLSGEEPGRADLIAAIQEELDWPLLARRRQIEQEYVI